MLLKKYPNIGNQYIIDLYNCDKKILNDKEKLKAAINAFIKDAGLKVVKTCEHEFIPHGLTSIFILSESHLAIHSWPEFGYLSIDLFLCHQRKCIKREHLSKNFLSTKIYIKHLRHKII